MSDLSGDHEIPVLVLGSGVTALGVVRTLGLAGIPLFVAGGGGVERSSRWYRRAPGRLEGGQLESFLDRSTIERAVLMPCSDGLVRAVARLPEATRARFPSSLPDHELLTALVDKAGLAELLTRHGVPHPKTVVVDDSSEGAPWDHDIENAFIKPRDSQRFFGKYGVKAFRPSGRDQVASLVDRAVGDGLEVVVQEYIPGPASNHYFIDGFVDRHGEVKAVFARRRLRMYPPWFGNSSALRSVSRDATAPAEEHLVRFLTEVGYRGIFSAEFKLDERDDTFRLLEINTRPWWYVEFATRAGVDVVSMAYADALDRPVRSVEGYVVGRTLVYPYYDFYACLEERRRGGSLLKGLASWIGADHTIFAWDDPRPFVADMTRASRRFVRRRLAKRSGSGSTGGELR